MPQKYLSAQSIVKCGAVLGLEHIEGGWKAREGINLLIAIQLLEGKWKGQEPRKAADVNIFNWELLTPEMRNIQPVGCVSPMK